MNIGQASRVSGLSTKMIRYYEKIGLLAPAKRTVSGYRQYADSDIRTLLFIKRSRALGFSLDRIKVLISLWNDRNRSSADVKRLALNYISELDKDIERLKFIRNELEHLASACHGDDRPECPILADLASRGDHSETGLIQ